MTRNWLLTVLVAASVGVASYLASSAVYSRQAAGPCGMTPLARFLDLTPEQRDQFRPVGERYRAGQDEACTEMQEARAELLSVLKQPSPSQADLDAALEKVSRAHARSQRRSAEYMLDIKPLLTPEQQDKLFDLVGQRFCGQGRCGADCCPAGGGPGRHGRRGCMQ